MDQIEDSIVDESFGTNSDSENDYQNPEKIKKGKEYRFKNQIGLPKKIII